MLLLLKQCSDCLREMCGIFRFLNHVGVTRDHRYPYILFILLEESVLSNFAFALHLELKRSHVHQDQDTNQKILEYARKLSTTQAIKSIRHRKMWVAMRHQAKVILIIKYTCTSLRTSELFQLANRPTYVSVCRGSYDRYFKRKRNNPKCDPWDSQGNEKYSCISIAFSVDILIRNENVIS